VGGAILVMVVLARNVRGLAIDRRGLALLVIVGGTAVGVFQLAYQLSTDAVGVPSTVALLYLAPALVAGASGPLLGEWPDRTRIALLVVTLSGVWLSVAGADNTVATFGSAGVGWGVLAGLSYGAYTLFGRFAAPRYGATLTTVYSTLGSCLFLLALTPVIGRPLVLPDSAAAWGLLFAFSLLTVAAAHLLFFHALSQIDASRASIATALEPVVAATLATLILGQGLSPLGWTGLAMVVGGVAGVGVTAAREASRKSRRSVSPAGRSAGGE
jgi:DME family drug/metabolite transporter